MLSGWVLLKLAGKARPPCSQAAVALDWRSFLVNALWAPIPCTVFIDVLTCSFAEITKQEKWIGNSGLIYCKDCYKAQGIEKTNVTEGKNCDACHKQQATKVVDSKEEVKF